MCADKWSGNRAPRIPFTEHLMVCFCDRNVIYGASVERAERSAFPQRLTKCERLTDGTMVDG
jgi:hypothetical protein